LTFLRATVLCCSTAAAVEVTLTDALDRLPDGFERRHNISGDAVERSDFFGDLVGGLLRLIGRILDLGCRDGKSRPASPARADSIVALSANKLICPVMSPMIWTMPLIASAAELSRFGCSSASSRYPSI
jgi:hypothetical protein